MSWIVIGQNKRFIELKSKKQDDIDDGLLTVGSFLTVETGKDSKIILRVEDTHQVDPYGPTPLVAEMDIGGLDQDVKCYNKILAMRIKHISKRTDGKYDFIPARSEARLASEDEIRLALNSKKQGPVVFPATFFGVEYNLIQSKSEDFVNIHLDEEMYWHQTVILGKTGSGKTVAIKHLAKHFIDEMQEVISEGHPTYGHQCYSKALAAHVGYPVGDVRPPLTTFKELGSEGEKRIERLSSLIKKLDILVNDLDRK